MGNPAYTPQNVAPQPGEDKPNCCAECHSDSLGNSNILPNPITINSDTSQQVCQSNPSRKELILVNTSVTDVIKIGLGFQPTQTNYTLALTPCINTDDDGTGGIWISDMWQGSIYAIAASDGCKVNFTEQV
jgi:hypothetical protein